MESKYEAQQKNYEGKAQRYLDNPKQAESLIKKAMGKANSNKGSLGDTWNKMQSLFELIRAWAKGDYKHVSKGTILAVIGTIIYFVSPLDIVPDFIAGLGILDDAAIIAFTWNRITKDIEEFNAWKNTIEEVRLEKA